MPGQKISSLTPVSDLQAADQFPLARSGSTYKITGDKFASKAQLDALSATAAGSFATKTSLNSLSAESDNDYNNLLSLLQSVSAALTTTTNTLSTNMQNIGNYPYLEYAWVTAPNAAGQSIPANTITTLNLNTEVADTGNFGSISSNQITFAAAGTYRYIAQTTLYSGTAGSASSSLQLFDGTNTIARIGPISQAYTSGSSNSTLILEGQSTFASGQTLTLRLLASNAASIQSGGDPFSAITGVSDQRTTIKLWKVG